MVVKVCRVFFDFSRLRPRDCRAGGAVRLGRGWLRDDYRA